MTMLMGCVLGICFVMAGVLAVNGLPQIGCGILLGYSITMLGFVLSQIWMH